MSFFKKKKKIRFRLKVDYIFYNKYYIYFYK